LGKEFYSAKNRISQEEVLRTTGFKTRWTYGEGGKRRGKHSIMEIGWQELLAKERKRVGLNKKGGSALPSRKIIAYRGMQAFILPVREGIFCLQKGTDRIEQWERGENVLWGANCQ